jgi:hypothetical protein
MIRDAKEIVECASLRPKRNKSWVNELTDSDCEFLMEIVVLASKRNCVNVSTLAKSIISELGINRSEDTVRGTLKELIDGAKKS